jgi:iron complex outermembrane receptor protein/hemoglobin/transferrin/lactoferrin receptor protein
MVFGGGVSYGKKVMAIVNIEQGIRPPNLDDLTARQSTGQGYQLDNENLSPEKALTIEAGIRFDLPWLRGEVVGFLQTLDDAIERKLLTPEDCRLSDDFVDNACRANRAPLQLVNLKGNAEILGIESRLDWRPSRAWRLQNTVSYARGEGANPSTSGPTRVPLSRIPPLNGAADITWQERRTGLYVGGGLRWAGKQDRLSVGDVADARIPIGGTPGHLVFDARAGIRTRKKNMIALVVENLSDLRYRTHGSGVLGAGRSVTVNLEGTL